jgi:hypothetical protein
MLKFCQTKLKVVVKLLDVKSNKHTVKLSAVRQSNEVGCMIIGEGKSIKILWHFTRCRINSRGLIT